MSGLNYIVDAGGNQIAVQIPITDWLLFKKEYEEVKRKLEILQGIKDAMQEMKVAKRAGKKLQTLSDFLNECWSHLPMI